MTLAGKPKTKLFSGMLTRPGRPETLLACERNSAKYMYSQQFSPKEVVIKNNKYSLAIYSLCCYVEEDIKKFRFSTNISLYLRNDAK